MRVESTYHARQLSQELNKSAQKHRDRLMYNVLPKAGQVKAGRAEDIRKAAQAFDFRTCFQLLEKLDHKMAGECFYAKGWDRHSSTLQPLLADLRDRILDVDWDQKEEG